MSAIAISLQNSYIYLVINDFNSYSISYDLPVWSVANTSEKDYYFLESLFTIVLLRLIL